VFALDTRVLFGETYEYWAAVEAKYGTKVEVFAAQDPPDRLWETDPAGCCGIRKVTPLREALSGLDAWITGMRREQSPTRSDISEAGWDEKHGLWKFNPLAEVSGKRLVVVDDTIVRGNTTKQIVAMLFEAGAAEVHVRISAPPIVSQCYYGIDFAQEDELIAAGRTVEEVREFMGATSLAFLSLDGLQASTRRPESSFCRACLTRDYPTAVPRESTKLRFETV
jgi:glutamine phosphoribosylpyrophosphate amidotransferase